MKLWRPPNWHCVPYLARIQYISDSEGRLIVELEDGDIPLPRQPVVLWNPQEPNA